MKKLIFIILFFIIFTNIVLCNEIYSYNNNTLYKFDNENISKLFIQSKIISDLLIDENNIYFNSKDFFYNINKSQMQINYKINIENINKIKQTENYIYAISNLYLYKINKNNGEIEYKYILNNPLENLYAKISDIFNYNYYNTTYGNVSGNFTNSFDEIFVNKISKKNGSGIIDINASLHSTISSFQIASSDNKGAINLIPSRIEILKDDTNYGCYIQLYSTFQKLHCEDAITFFTSDLIFNTTEFNFVFNYNYNDKIKINSSGIYSPNLKNNIIITKKYTNLYPSQRTWDITYYNNFSHPIIVNARVYRDSATLESSSSNFVLNDKVYNTMFVPNLQTQIQNINQIIPSKSYYKLYNDSVLNVYTVLEWYENNMSLI